MTASSRTNSAHSTLSRRSFVLLAGALGALGLAGCSSASQGTSERRTSASTGGAEVLGTNPSDMSTVTIDRAAWSYDADNDVYYQLGVQYCATPAATDYESMGIYVPGAYFSATNNGNGSYTCTVNESGSVGNYSATTAPIVIPVNTAGYSAQAAPTSYSSNGLTDYLSAGLIYVYPGCRGRNNGKNSDGSSFAGGAPWGVTDLKAAVRCLRYNASALPGRLSNIFTFGHSDGGAQSSLMGATGDSALYAPYLSSIGAVFTDDSGSAISDAITGSMCWCPITSLNVANEAYEWMMGQFSTTGTRADGTWTKALSDDMCSKFADHINDLKLQGTDGNTLTLSKGGEGIYTFGSYYDEVKGAIETSLNNFLADTAFPYTPSSNAMADGGFAGGGTTGGSTPFGEAPGDSGGAPSAGAPPAGDSVLGDSTTYETAEAYVASLNSDTAWISYDSSTNTASVMRIDSFVAHCKSASKDVGAFDALDRSQAENYLFGNSQTDALHFDATMADLLLSEKDRYATYSGFDVSYADAYAGDMDNVDDLGTKSAIRQDMYNPMYYVTYTLAGYGSATVAPHWRIRSGIDQTDSSLTTELNLALALKANPHVKDVDFATVWSQGHTMAERTGSGTANFIEWVRECCA